MTEKRAIYRGDCYNAVRPTYYMYNRLGNKRFPTNTDNTFNFSLCFKTEQKTAGLLLFACGETDIMDYFYLYLRNGCLFYSIKNKLSKSISSEMCPPVWIRTFINDFWHYILFRGFKSNKQSSPMKIEIRICSQKTKLCFVSRNKFPWPSQRYISHDNCHFTSDQREPYRTKVSYLGVISQL